MSCLRIQLLLEDNTWITRYTVAKNDTYSNSSSDWILLCLIFTLENLGKRLFLDQPERLLADMCFSNISITQSV